VLIGEEKQERRGGIETELPATLPASNPVKQERRGGIETGK